jgi:ribosomal protein S18 acetylase RimI-like enzyme
MSPVRRLNGDDASLVAFLAAEQLSRHASREPLVSAHFDRRAFEQGLASSYSPTWVDDSNGRLRGHLYGATLEDALHQRETWTGPDGWSFFYEDSLDRLLDWALPYWRDEGSHAHVVWVPVGLETEAWTQRGYETISIRAGLELAGAHLSDVLAHPNSSLTVRRGSDADLETALAFDALIDAAQGVDLESLSEAERDANRSQLSETLSDSETHYYLLEIDGAAIAQCVTFPLPELRGTHPATLYVSDVAVQPALRGQGFGQYVVRTALHDALGAGFTHAEVRWRASNELASRTWRALGFRPTYLQMRRRFND